MTTFRQSSGAFTLLALSVLCACDAGAAPRSLQVFAASSLTAPFTALEQAFESVHPGLDVQCNFAGSPQLVLQIEQGAAADVFAAADLANMAKVQAFGKAVGEPRRFARNRLAIVVAEGNPRAIHGLGDLARDGSKVALCGPEVPAGRYARQALDKAKVIVRSLSDEPNVHALLAKVRLGELDAGIVFATDCITKGIAAVAIAAEHQVVADYPIVALTADTTGTAAAFVDFVLSPSGQQVLAAHGFQAP
jgi:molybdate transport system substrate-binding protein